MTTIKKSTLFVLCVASLSQLTLVSCNDDDLDNEVKEEQKMHEQTVLENDLISVLSKLTDVNDLPDDWENQTYTANIGSPSEQSEATRLVATNDATTAALRFEDMTGVDVSNLNAYTWTRDFGSLTYTKTTDGTSWATVDVDIKQLPGLKRIVYCSPDQMGLNGNFVGNAYYRFGDVISKKNSDGDLDYWICVRPAFGVEGKEDSHWITLSKLPSKNLYTYTNSANTTHKLPTKLTSSKEHMKNLSEMLYAITHPDEWAQYYQNNPGERLFHDFRSANIKYHNRYFWMLVQQAWDKQKLWQQLLHTTREDIAGRNELIYFYSGYTWWAGATGNVYVAKYNGDLLKKQTTTTLEYDFKAKDKPLWDINDWATTGQNANYEPRSAFVVRYATGKDLLGSQPNVFQSMANSNDIKDVYVFNVFHKQPIGSGEENMPTVFTSGHVTKAEHWGFFHPGTVIQDEDGHLWMCYLNWCDQDEEAYTFHTDHKARFISFDAVQGKKEEIEYIYDSYAEKHPECTTGTFATNLVPEDQAYTVAWCLEEMAAPTTTHGHFMGTSMRDVLGVNPEDLVVLRDSMLNDNGKMVKSRIFATNVAYIPTEGRKEGFQPMLRYVNDGTRVAANRDDSNDPYWYNYYYTRYTDDNNVPLNLLGRTIDVLDIYKWAQSIEDEDLLGDRWSILPWNVNNLQYKYFDHTHLLTIPYHYRDFAYDTKAHKWKNSLYGDDVVPKYMPSLYLEPVVMMAYMEIDDDDQQAFKRIYGGKRYTLVSDPLPEAVKQTTFSYMLHLRDVVDKYTFINEERKNGYVYRW